MDLRTVRGEIRIPSFSNSSWAIRSSPQIGFYVAIRRIKTEDVASVVSKALRQSDKFNRTGPGMFELCAQS